MHTLYTATLNTPLGDMMAIADHEKLYLLDFINRNKLDRQLKRIMAFCSPVLIPGSSPPILAVQVELEAYFDGRLKQFKTPFCLVGSVFQKKAWEALCGIPYGARRSYLQQAAIIGNPKAFRAVAGANSCNAFAIMVPCHRVINASGKMGGYAGGLSRKLWLLEHEQNVLAVF